MNPDTYAGDAALSPVYSRRPRGASANFEGSEVDNTASFPSASITATSYNSPTKEHVDRTLFEMDDNDTAGSGEQVHLHPPPHRRGSNSKDPRGFKKYRFVTMMIAGLLCIAGILYYLFFGISGEINGVNGVVDLVTNKLGDAQIVIPGGTAGVVEPKEREEGHDREILVPVRAVKAASDILKAEERVETVVVPKPPAIAIEVERESPKLNMDAVNEMDPEDLEAHVLEDIERIRDMRKGGVVIETSNLAQTLIRQVQDVLRIVLVHKYGEGPYQISMDLEFPDSMVHEGEPSIMSADGVVSGADPTMRDATILFELAPTKFVPYSVYYFLENIVHDFHHGAFHRNAGHVLQVSVEFKICLLDTVFSLGAWRMSG